MEKLNINVEDNFLQFDFKENFIIAIANLIGTCVNMIKSLINTCKIFETSWLTNIKTECLNKKEESNTEADESQNA